MSSYLFQSFSAPDLSSAELSYLAAEEEEEPAQASSRSSNTGETTVSSPTPFPWKTGLVLAAINFNEGFQMMVIAPFAPFLVGYYFGQDNPQLGFIVSSLLSAFFFGQFLTAAPWGRLSDRLGRKPILLAGLGGSGFSVVLFGLGLPFPVVLLARFLGGCLNGNVGITRSYMGEITDKTNQATGYSVLNVSWTAGSFVGPLVGGYLSYPGQHLEWFNTPFWTDYPFLLPCLLSCFISVLGSIFGIGLLAESKVWLESRATLREQQEAEKHDNSSSLHNERHEGIKLVATPHYQKLDEDLSQKLLKDDSLRRSASHDSTFSQDLDHPHEILSSSYLGGSGHGHGHDREDQPLLTEGEGDSEGQQCLCKCFCVSRRCLGCERCLRKTILAMPKDIQDRDVILTSILWALCGAGISMHDSILAVYLQTPITEGGLGWSVDQIGVLLSIQGVAFVLWQALFYRLFNRHLGHVGTATMATFSLGVYCLLLPTTSFTSRIMSDFSTWIIMILLICVRAAMGTSQGTSVITIINNSARPANRGSVNGFAQSIGALTRAFAPLLAGTIYSLSLDTQFVLAPYAAFVSVTASFWSACAFAFQLPRTLNAPKLDAKA